MIPHNFVFIQEELLKEEVTEIFEEEESEDPVQFETHVCFLRVLFDVRVYCGLLNVYRLTPIKYPKTQIESG